MEVLSLVKSGEDGAFSWSLRTPTEGEVVSDRASKEEPDMTLDDEAPGKSLLSDMISLAYSRRKLWSYLQREADGSVGGRKKGVYL